MKLPALPYRTGTPTLRSSEQAALGNKLRAIDATQGAISQGLNTLDREFEQEARLSSMKRFNEARRQYSERVTQITQEFQSDDSKPVEEFAVALREARSEIFSTAQEGASVRSQKYLNSDIDSYNTQAQARELESVRTLTMSRSAMALEDMAKNSVAFVHDTPDYDLVEAELAQYEDAVTASPLPAPDKRKLMERYSSTLVVTAAQSMLRSGRVAEAVALQGSEAYASLTPSQRASVDQSVAAAAIEAQSVAVSADTNAVILGQMSLDDMFKRVEDRAELMTPLTGKEYDEYVRDRKGDAAYYAFDSMISAGKVDEVQTELQSGDYNSVMDPDKMRMLQGRLNRALAAGGSSRVPAVLEVAYERQVKRMLAVAEAGGAPPPPQELAKAEQLLTDYERLYYDAGTEPTKTALNLMADLRESIGDMSFAAQVIQEPNAANADVLKTVYGEDADSWDGRYIEMKVREAIATRSAAIKEDAVRMAKDYNLADIETMPAAIGSEEWSGWLERRFSVTVPKMYEAFGTYDISGGLSATEVETINRWLRDTQGQNTPDGQDMFIATATQLRETIGDDSMFEEFFIQLTGDDTAESIPLMARAAGMGRPRAAELMAKGQTVLANGDITFTGSTGNTMDVAIQDHLGNALSDFTVGIPGSEQLVYTQYVDGVKKAYAGLLLEAGKRGQTSGVENDLLKQAIKEVTGGVVERHGQSFLMPPNATPRDLNRFMSRQNADTLPALYDGENRRISPEEISVHWDSRYRFTSAGRPGKYYVQDVMTGEFLRDDKQSFATVMYNPKNVVAGPGADVYYPGKFADEAARSE